MSYERVLCCKRGTRDSRGNGFQLSEGKSKERKILQFNKQDDTNFSGCKFVLSVFLSFHREAQSRDITFFKYFSLKVFLL